jgi:hypothetical protein
MMSHECATDRRRSRLPAVSPHTGLFPFPVIEPTAAASIAVMVTAARRTAAHLARMRVPSWSYRLRSIRSPRTNQWSFGNSPEGCRTTG